MNITHLDSKSYIIMLDDTYPPCHNVLYINYELVAYVGLLGDTIFRQRFFDSTRRKFNWMLNRLNHPLRCEAFRKKAAPCFTGDEQHQFLLSIYARICRDNAKERLQA